MTLTVNKAIDHSSLGKHFGKITRKTLGLPVRNCMLLPGTPLGRTYYDTSFIIRGYIDQIRPLANN